MKSISTLIKRNIKLFFKDKGLFITSLITPAILLVLYATFLKNVFKETFISNIPETITLSEKLINGYIGSQLISSILAVSCITVAFCCNFLMIQDKANGTIKDLLIAPVKKSHLAISYYLTTFISTLLICLVAMIICLIYIANIGWFFCLTDVLLLTLDIFILVLFGTALSSIINHFLSTQGQMSAVGTIISSGYGFICGAYMPISTFPSGLQKVIYFLPGTYGTSLIRNHSLNGIFKEMKTQGVPDDVILLFKEALDCNIKFFDQTVSIPMMYIILTSAIIILIIAYILINYLRKKAK